MEVKAMLIMPTLDGKISFAEIKPISE